jgi:hypothetical protein
MVWCFIEIISSWCGTWLSTGAPSPFNFQALFLKELVCVKRISVDTGLLPVGGSSAATPQNFIIPLFLG